MARPVADEKKYFRAILSDCRFAISAETVFARSREIARNLLSGAFYRDTTQIVLYAAAGNEVATDGICSSALADGKRVYFPRLNGRSSRIEIAEISCLLELTPGAFGIPEPPPNRAATDPAALEQPIVCVPGVAFSISGDRIGRGGGHYDRFLAQLAPEAITIGLAYSFQLLDRIPVEPFDQRLNLIITESAVHRASSAPHECARSAGQGGTPGWL